MPTPINEIRRVVTTPEILIPRNTNRSSFNVVNQHPTIGIWVAYGSKGMNVATTGNREGIYIGPNGGQLYDDTSESAIYAIANAINNRVMVIESGIPMKMKVNQP